MAITILNFDGEDARTERVELSNDILKDKIKE